MGQEVSWETVYDSWLEDGSLMSVELVGIEEYWVGGDTREGAADMGTDGGVFGGGRMQRVYIFQIINGKTENINSPAPSVGDLDRGNRRNPDNNSNNGSFEPDQGKIPIIYVHHVRKGEEPKAIAEKYNITRAQLREYNRSLDSRSGYRNHYGLDKVGQATFKAKPKGMSEDDYWSDSIGKGKLWNINPGNILNVTYVESDLDRYYHQLQVEAIYEIKRVRDPHRSKILIDAMKIFGARTINILGFMTIGSSWKKIKHIPGGSIIPKK